MQVCGTADFSPTPLPILVVFAGMFLFYLNSYSEFVAHARTNNTPILSFCLFHIAVAVFPEIRSLLRTFPFLILFVCFIFLNGRQNIVNVIKKSFLDSNARSRAVCGLMPLIISVALFARNVRWYRRSWAFPYLAISMGFVMIYHIQQIILVNLVGRSPWRLFSVLDFVFWIPILTSRFVDQPEFGYWFWVWYSLAIGIIVFLFDVLVVWRFSRGLKISVFVIDVERI
jgi:hypothetical protein